MNNVNWWLMALSFLLGLVLTLIFMIRRVRREVPTYATAGRGAQAATRTTVDETPRRAATAATVAAAAGAGAAPAVAKLVKDEPYGAGSVQTARTLTSPGTGYQVKGDEDTMRYFTVGSPDYDRVGAEIWFKDAESAERAGFLRWNAPGDYTVTDHIGEATGRNGEASTATTRFASVADDTEAGPFGHGSARAGAGGVGPSGWLIKGNEDSMLFHTPASPSYQQTVAEVWFVDEATAQAAGFKKYR
jgi:hypothetical protein